MPTLVYSDVDGVDRSFALGNEPVTIGRAPECSIRSQDPRVSRVHARFYIDQGVLWIEDAGSSNGIYVGPNKVQRAPVPTGEIILVGSLMIRLLPASGTLPPPVGLHGTLATWLEMERKSRVAIEDERDAFARRVGEMHGELAAARAAVNDDKPTPDPDAANDLAEAIRMRDEAIAKTAMLERTLNAISDETQANREQFDKLRRNSSAEIEAVRIDLAKAREAKMVAETQTGMAVAEKLAETDMVIANLQKDLETAKKLATAPNEAAKALQDQISAITTRAEKAEKDLSSAQIRAQGAERNLSHANAMAAKAETRVSQLDGQLKDAEEKAKLAEQKRAAAAEQVAALESRAGAQKATAALEASEQRAKKLAADLADANLALESHREKLAIATTTVAETEARASAAEAAVGAAKADADKAVATAMANAKAELAKLGDAGKRVVELEAKIASLGQAEVAIAASTTSRDAAVARAQTSDQKATEALAKVDEADKRSTAAETMAKAMAKDVAESMRRAAEADAKLKSVGRDLADAARRVEEAEAMASKIVEAAEAKTAMIEAANARAETAEAAAKQAAAEAEAAIAAARSEADAAVAAAQSEAGAQIAQVTADAAAKTAKTEQDLGAKVVDTQQLLAARIESTRKELTAKLDQAQRELAAERSTAMQLVDRKTQLERELADFKVNMPPLAKRAEAAEAARAELEAQIEALNERVIDLESRVAVAETSASATSSEGRERIAQLEREGRERMTALEKELASAKASGTKSAELADSLRVKLKLVEGELSALERSRTDGDGALKASSGRIVELEKLLGERASQVADSKEQVTAAMAKLQAIEAGTEDLRRSAEAADLAIGRAGALQRQLDEAITKLAYLERELGAARSGSRGDGDALAAAETRARDAEQRLREASSGGDQRTREAEQRAASAEQRARESKQEIVKLQTELGDLESRVTATGRASESRIGEADRRLAEASKRVAELERELSSRPSGPVTSSGVDGPALAEARKRIADLEREIQKADNVRSFAAETEREIAQFQRDLREARTKLASVTLERDRFESELRDSRGDAETTNRRLAVDERGEARYENILAKFTESEQRLQRAERDNMALKKHTAEIEARLEAALDRLEDKDEATATGNQMPLAEIVEHVSILEESIDSLRANMRAASDETALMDQTDSVVAVSSAVSQAAEHIERARASIRSLLKTIRTT